ncbi:hypothetical protein GJ496_004802 [Pomphorhynchus laevis]|nr:hypothetical protein GJ496_004802 [Pomphorhynchus laevis]
MDDKSLSQSLVGLMRNAETKLLADTELRKRINPSFSKVSASSHQSDLLTSATHLHNQRSQSLIRPIYSSLSSSVVSNSRSLSNLSKQKLDRRNVKLGPNSHNKLVEKLMRKDSRFVDQLVDWLDEGVGSGFGILSLEDGVQDMLEVVMCDFVVDMCRGACKLASTAQKVANNDVKTDINCKRLSQDFLRLTEENDVPHKRLNRAASNLDIVYHCEKVTGIPVPNMLLSLHRVSTRCEETLPPSKRLVIDPIKPRLFNIKSSSSNDTEDRASLLSNNATDSQKVKSSISTTVLVYGFRDECIRKYKNKGQVIIMAVHNLCASLSLVTVIDGSERVAIMHGGISNGMMLNSIQKIDRRKFTTMLYPPIDQKVKGIEIVSL